MVPQGEFQEGRLGTSSRTGHHAKAEAGRLMTAIARAGLIHANISLQPASREQAIWNRRSLHLSSKKSKVRPTEGPAAFCYYGVQHSAGIHSPIPDLVRLSTY